VGAIALVVYLTIVVISTPSLRPVDAISISVAQNWWLVGGVAVGSGVQVFLLSYAKAKACSLRNRNAVIGASGFFSGLSSFLSFLSLIPVGCCGTWVYVISFMPGLIGAGASGFLVRNSVQIEGLSLALMATSVVYTYLSVRRKLIVSGSTEGGASPKALHPVSSVMMLAAALGSIVLFIGTWQIFNRRSFVGLAVQAW
jgi:hypothetical protein